MMTKKPGMSDMKLAESAMERGHRAMVKVARVLFPLGKTEANE